MIRHDLFIRTHIMLVESSTFRQDYNILSQHHHSFHIIACERNQKSGDLTIFRTASATSLSNMEDPSGEEVPALSRDVDASCRDE